MAWQARVRRNSAERPLRSDYLVRRRAIGRVNEVRIEFANESDGARRIDGHLHAGFPDAAVIEDNGPTPASRL